MYYLIYKDSKQLELDIDYLKAYFPGMNLFYEKNFMKVPDISFLRKKLNFNLALEV